jgi:hypothetical protein
MTDVTFRLDGPYRPTLDSVARDLEPELDAVVARRTTGAWGDVHRIADRLYRVKAARAWLEPAVNVWPARVVAAPGREGVLLDRVNAAFTLEKLRSMAQADVETADTRDADFGRFVESSALPLMLSAARESDLRICLVRVMRRPANGAPPPQSAELQRYVADMRAYVEAHGGVFVDDHDSPELAQLPYADGDHVSRDARIPYTDHFWSVLQRLAAR